VSTPAAALRFQVALALAGGLAACVAGQQRPNPSGYEEKATKFETVERLSDVPGLAPVRYSHAAWSPGELVFFAGQIPLDERGNLVGRGDFAAQAKQVFSNLRRVLEATGCSPADVLKIKYFLVGVDLERLHTLRTLVDSMFPGPKPASTLLGVASLANPEILIEVEMIAARRR